MFKDICRCSNSFYFIGIGGVSMSALAKLMYFWGKKIAGSDIVFNDYINELQTLGIKVNTSGIADDISGFDVIIYTDAVSQNDILLAEARKLNKIILSRGQFLNEVSKNFGSVIAVSGCHGKTTCTAMLAHIFKAADKKFCVHIGGRDLTFGNLYIDGKDYFITEACEYKKNFLYLTPAVGIVLSSDADHLECYGNAEELKKSYKIFADSSHVKIGLYGDIISGGLTFGFNKNASYSARAICQTEEKYSFDAYEGDTKLGRIILNVYGKHNILNALAAIAAARSAQIGFNQIKLGLSQFNGVERRFEKLGKINGAEVIADYAHHPGEIAATLKTVKKIAAENMYVVFQPHTYSRTKLLFKKFVRVLSPLQNLLIYKTYAAREFYDDEGSALTLSLKIKNSRYGEDERDITEFVARASQGDMILFLGAGDIYQIAKRVVKNLSAHP